MFHTDAIASESDLCNVALTKIELLKDESVDDIDNQLKLRLQFYQTNDYDSDRGAGKYALPNKRISTSRNADIAFVWNEK